MTGLSAPTHAEDSEEALAELRTAYGAGNNSELIWKALSLARLAAKNADENGDISLKANDGKVFVVNLRG